MVHEVSQENPRFWTCSNGGSGMVKALNAQNGVEKSSNGGCRMVDNIQDELALRKAEEAASRRSEASQWLRQMDGGAQGLLPESPSNEEFCFFLKNGLILCNVLNRVNPGAVSKVVESPIASVELIDGPAQSVIQYFENMRNFIIAVAEMNLLTFEASDLEEGGSSSKVVDCILCLKGYHEWKLSGGVGIWRYGGTVKITSTYMDPGSSFRGGEYTDESSRHSISRQNQQFLEVPNLSCEESDMAEGVNHIFDKLALRLLYTYLTERKDSGDLISNKMIIDMVLHKAVDKFNGLLENKGKQLIRIFDDEIKNESRSLPKELIMKVISKYLDEKNSHTSNGCSSFCTSCVRCGDNQVDKPVTDNQEKLLQQRQIEELRSLYLEMKGQVQCVQEKWKEESKKLEHHVQGLEMAANSYYKLLEENRLLYNQVQDLKGSIRVFCRVRPFLPAQCSEKSIVDYIGENGNIIITNRNKQGKDARKIFSFDKVFGPNVTQQQVFAHTQPLIRSVLDGYNVCIFAYGQTGSGKTYTMNGPNPTLEETWGVSYRALSDLFQISSSRTDTIIYNVNVQMIEIYNEQVRDLLVVQETNRRLDIRNNSQLNGLNVPDACLIPVNCTQDVLDLMKIGQGNRAVGATALNERSSRSHSVLTVHVQGKELVSGMILKGCLHLVDLAGSERADKSEAVGERQKEAQHINRSLSALGDVISALARKSAHIPYRNSKLTQVLQDVLGGQAKMLMLVHINPEIDAIGETISTLKFAERVASVDLGATHANKEAVEVRELKEEVSKLKLDLESKECQVEQLKNTIACGIYVEPHKPTANIRCEASQQISNDARSSEFRNCSGRSQKTRSRTGYKDMDCETKSPSTGENFAHYKRLISPFSPGTQSLSTDRGSLRKIKPMLAKPDGRNILKLQSPVKVSTNQSLAVINKKPVSDSMNGCRALLENRNLKKVYQENEKQDSPEAAATAVTFKMSNSIKIKSKSKHYQSVCMTEDSDINNGDGLGKIRRKNEFTEVETENRFVEQYTEGTPKSERLHPKITRILQDIRPRSVVQVEESLSTGKHENNPPKSVAILL